MRSRSAYPSATRKSSTAEARAVKAGISVSPASIRVRQPSIGLVGSSGRRSSPWHGRSTETDRKPLRARITPTVLKESDLERVARRSAELEDHGRRSGRALPEQREPDTRRRRQLLGGGNAGLLHLAAPGPEARQSDHDNG